VRATKTLYQVLQIDPEAEPDVIEVVYRKLARKYHPDVSPMPDAAERMKEINSAYEILHDPRRRATYDRELAFQQASPRENTPVTDFRWVEETEPWAPPQVGGCVRHPGFGAVANCTDCGASLCAYCARLFQPPTCSTCLLRWARRKRFRLGLPALALPGLFAVGYLGWAGLLQAVLGLQPPLWLLLLLAYWTGSIAFGVRGAREMAPQSDAIVSGFIACLVAPVATPVLIGKSLWEYRKIQVLEAMARSE